MFRRAFSCLFVGLLFFSALAPCLRAADALKVRYVTGGGWHDYKALAPMLTEGMSKIANVEFDIRWAPEALRDKQLGDGADAIVYSICFGEERDPAIVDNLLRITREGKPTVLVHCSMHCFTASEEWTECCGQRTRKHDNYRAFGTKKVDAEHPILKSFPDDWKTPGDELYQTIQFGKDSHPLLMAKGEADRENIVCWTHQYGKGRIFATTLGHDMKTAAQADYHSLLAHGLLWACDQLDDNGKAKAGYEAPSEK